MIVNGRITSAFLGMEEHGFTAMLYLENQGGSQGYGGFAFGNPPKDAFAGRCVYELLRALGVKSWEALPGSFCRVDLGSGAWNSKIERIGHLIEDRWFSFAAIASGLEAER